MGSAGTTPDRRTDSFSTAVAYSNGGRPLKKEKGVHFIQFLYLNCIFFLAGGLLQAAISLPLLPEEGGIETAKDK